MKRVMLYLFVSTAFLLLLISCGSNALDFMADKDSDEAKRVEILNALDDGDYQTVIDKLTGSSYGFTEEERQINLAAAYMGSAGYDLPSVAIDILDAVDESEESGKDVMWEFANIIRKKATDGGLTKLNKGEHIYEILLTGLANSTGEIFDPEDCRDEANYEGLSNAQKDACVLRVVACSAQAGTTIGSFIGDVGVVEDLTVLFDMPDFDSVNPDERCSLDVDLNDTADSIESVTCALQYANYRTVVNGQKLSPSDCPLNPTAIANIPFTYSSGKTENLTALKITIGKDIINCSSKSDYVDYKLVQIISDGSKISSPVATDGYCHKENTSNTCTKEEFDDELAIGFSNSISCWFCPAESAEGESLTIVDSILDSFEVIEAFIAEESDTDTGMLEGIDSFTKDICVESDYQKCCEGTADPATCPTGETGISQADLLNYFLASGVSNKAGVN